jgi:hypothetical protein
MMMRNEIVLFLTMGTLTFPISHAFQIIRHPAFSLKQPMTKTTTALSFFSLFGESGDDPDRFVREIFRMEKVSSDLSKEDSLVQYIKEWSLVFVENPSSGLTTPVRVDTTETGIEIRFVPKRATGKKFKSSKEEKELENQGLRVVTNVTEPSEEGGVKIDVLKDKFLSVHAKRFNYGEDVSVKEMSEETIIAKFKDAITTWKKEQN